MPQTKNTHPGTASRDRTSHSDSRRPKCANPGPRVTSAGQKRQPQAHDTHKKRGPATEGAGQRHIPRVTNQRLPWPAKNGDRRSTKCAGRQKTRTKAEDMGEGPKTNATLHSSQMKDDSGWLKVGDHESKDNAAGHKRKPQPEATTRKPRTNDHISQITNQR